MKDGHQPEDAAKKQPGQEEGQAEDDEHPPPADVHTCGKDVSQVPLTLLAHVDELHVAVTVLLYKSALRLVPRVHLALAVAVGYCHCGKLHAVLL